MAGAKKVKSRNFLMGHRKVPVFGEVPVFYKKFL